MSILNRIFKHKTYISLDAVSFDVSKYRYEREKDNERFWFTSSGDGISITFCPGPPSLPTTVNTIVELQQFYVGRVCNEQVRMAEFRISPVADVNSIWMILKLSRQPHGMDYIGSLTIPFADFSFVIKMQCDELGITGIRETALMLKARLEGKVAIGADGKLSGDWNPDAAVHDDKFPDHPISRLRREFAQIISSLKISDVTKRQKRFELPTPAA